MAPFLRLVSPRCCGLSLRQDSLSSEESCGVTRPISFVNISQDMLFQNSNATLRP
jgi:hypothetical protein